MAVTGSLKTAPPPAEVPADQIRQELDKILASSCFATARRLRVFLRYIVEKTLSGRSEDLKEYVVAVEVFGRRPDFDPRTDPIVRVEAGRLRTRIRDYYRKDGKLDEVRIECAKGGYHAIFRTATRKSDRGPNRMRAGRGPALAVLPFYDLSPTRDQEYFCDGLTEELISVLAKVEGVRVVSRTSVLALRGQNLDIREIGKRLNVSAILEGSVRKDGDRIRITAQLTSVADRFELWSESHERRSEDLFLVQDEVALSIVNNIRMKLLGHEAANVIERHTESVEAYRLYLNGRHYWNKRTEESLKTGIRHFEAAIARDPKYALAYAGIADSYAILGTRGALAPSEAMPKAKTAAREALALNEGLAEAHASVALVSAVYDWDWRNAEKQFQKAIVLNPAYTTARHWYAYNCLVPAGRIDEAILQVREALDHDPVSLIVNSVLGQLYSMTGRYDDAIEQLTKAMTLDANFYFAHWYLGLAYVQKKMYRQAIRSLNAALKLAGFIPAIAGSLAHAHAMSGDTDEARKVLIELETLSAGRYVSSEVFAQIHAALGDERRALAYLKKALEERAPSLVHLLVNPVYHRLVSNSKFGQIIRTVDLAPPK
jgi:serine/threonine-protein kinase